MVCMFYVGCTHLAKWIYVTGVCNLCMDGVGPISFSKCKAIGAGLQGGYAGQTLSFVIVPYDDYNNVNSEGNVTISVSFTPNVTSAVHVSRNDSGIFIFHYCILVAQTYSLKIVGQTPTAELSIPGSPFEITVIAGFLTIELFLFHINDFF